MQTVWSVRARTDGGHEQFNFRENVTSMDWASPDPWRFKTVAAMKRDQIAHSWDGGADAAGIIWRFAHRAKIGDIVVLPCMHPQSRGRIAVGRIVGNYQYHGNAPGGEPWHRTPVEWLSYDIADLLTPETRDSFGSNRRATAARIFSPPEVLQDILSAVARLTGKPSV
jgi:predicted Mrr-cat superfamily restriction endonuclease